MQFYKVTYDEGEKPTYLCTRVEAHNKAKEAQPWQRPNVLIELIEIDTDKATLAGILSGWGCEEKSAQSWHLSPRGGLVKNKEAP